jgi:alpha-ribazole phosphatase/probable phosphoglycerate mutase
MPIYLVRHGETRLTGTYCGSSNPPLTPHGREQALIISAQLSRLPIDIGYSSPQLRATQTAAIINRRLKIPFMTRYSLRELNFGAWEGCRFDEIEAKWPGLAKEWSKDPMTVRIPGAESFSSLRRRIERFLAYMRKKNVLIVAHGGSLSAIILELLGLPDREFPKHILPTGSVQMIQGKKVRTLC